MRRAAFYARVSSPHQAKEETIESQIEQLLAYAAQKQYDLPPGLRFMDKPGANDFLVRPGLDRLRDAAAAGAFQVLLCQNVDRIARNLGAQYVLLCELEQVGVEVIFLNEPNWGRDPQLNLLRNIQGAVAEYERILIQERMRRGRLYRLRHGQAVPTQAPYGYRFQPAALGQPSAWVAVPEEAWSGTTLGRLLRQPAYKGIAYYNRRQTERSGLGQQRRPGPGR
jgi:site-specific DNA recombinase